MSYKQALDAGVINNNNTGEIINATTVNADTVNSTTVNATQLNTSAITADGEFGLVLDCVNGLQVNINGSTGGIGNALTVSNSGVYAEWQPIPYPTALTQFISKLVVDTSSTTIYKPQGWQTALVNISLVEITPTVPSANTFNTITNEQYNNVDDLLQTRTAVMSMINSSEGIANITFKLQFDCSYFIVNTIMDQPCQSFYIFADLIKLS